MKNEAYWMKRAEDISNIQFEKVDNYKEKLEKEYEKALKSIQTNIDELYKKVAENNGFSMLKAKKLLNSNELADFRMSLDEFIKKAKENSNLKWEKQLNNMSLKVRISRLEAIKFQMLNSIESLYIDQKNDFTDILDDIYRDTYYRNIYEISKGLGVNVNFSKLDNKIVESILSQKWLGSNYSERIWKNKEKLITSLETSLSQAFIRGYSLEKTSKVIANNMNVSMGAARRLVNTESAYISEKATYNSYIESDVEKYEILATLDLKTSKICRDIDGEVFDTEKFKVGVNAPPFHPNCRTTTVPYFDDEFTLGEERAFRDSNGKTDYMDSKMTYKDWYKKYVESDPKYKIEETKYTNRHTDKKQHERYLKVLGKDLPGKLDDFQNLKYTDNYTWELMKDYFKSRSNNMISAFTSFKEYSEVKEAINKDLVGLVTPNGIIIKGQSKHFIERVFGTSNDPNTCRPRSGVELSDIKDTIVNGIIRTRKNDPESIKLISEKCIVSINPNTGILIQTNPQ